MVKTGCGRGSPTKGNSCAEGKRLNLNNEKIGGRSAPEKNQALKKGVSGSVTPPSTKKKRCPNDTTKKGDQVQKKKGKPLLQNDAGKLRARRKKIVTNQPAGRKPKEQN